MTDQKFKDKTVITKLLTSSLFGIGDTTAGSGNKWNPAQSILDILNFEITPIAVTTILTSANWGQEISLSGATFTLTLQTAVGQAGRTMRVSVDPGSVGIYTIDPTGSQTIDGALTIDMIDGDFIELRSDGANWQVTRNKNNALALSDKPVAVTTTLTVLDWGKLITLSGATFTLTMQTAVGQAGRIMGILVDPTAVGIYTIDGSGAQTLGGNADVKMVAGDYLQVRSDGANWEIIDSKSNLIDVAENPKSSTSTLVLADWGKTVILSGATFTLTLQTAVGQAGRVLNILVQAGETGIYTIAASGFQDIAGNTTYKIVDGEFLSIRSDGSDWQIVHEVYVTHAIYSDTSSQAVTASSENLDYGTKLDGSDLHGAWDGNQYVVPQPGIYAARCSLNFTSGGASAFLKHQGNTRAYGNDFGGTSTGVFTVFGTFFCNVGDTIEFRSDGGGTRSSNGDVNSMSISRIG